MNVIEVGDVLAKIQLGDSRQVDEAVLAYWVEGISALDCQDALAAVTLHRQERPGVWLDIGHVWDGVRRVRDARAREERKSRKVLEPAKITLDREQHEAEFQAALAKHRAERMES